MIAKRVITAKGQTLLEFALILPVLLMVAFFILDFGRAVYYYSALYNGAREGARFGTTLLYVNEGLEASDQVLIEQAALQHMYGLPRTGPDKVTISSSIYQEASAIVYINVTARYTYEPVTPFLAIILPSGIQLETNSRMRIEPRINMKLLLPFNHL